METLFAGVANRRLTPPGVVKVTDILGNDRTKTTKVKVP
jgi:hypothetical protein